MPPPAAPRDTILDTCIALIVLFLCASFFALVALAFNLFALSETVRQWREKTLHP